MLVRMSTNPSPPPGPSHPSGPANAPPVPPASPWLLVLLGAILLVVVLVGRWWGPQETVSPEPKNGSATPLVEVDPSEGVSLSMELARSKEPAGDSTLSPAGTLVLSHQAEMTVLDLLLKASERSSDWRFRYQGRREGVFLQELSGVKNEESQGPNWQFWVNGERAEVSCGIYLLAPGVAVLWKFAPYE